CAPNAISAAGCNTILVFPTRPVALDMSRAATNAWSIATVVGQGPTLSSDNRDNGTAGQHRGYRPRSRRFACRPAARAEASRPLPVRPGCVHPGRTGALVAVCGQPAFRRSGRGREASEGTLPQRLAL